MEAGNIDEAIELAKQLNEAGRYNWFRGQAKNYRVVASLYRLNDVDRNAALEPMGRFESWVKITPGLEELAAQGVDAILAVAQHYRMPTSFVDFTTDPTTAGFFASDSSDLVAGELSCIICLNTDDFLEFWTSMPSNYTRPECLDIDVSNLWRLQAQQGVFLYNPYDDIERLYDFDRILFPAGRSADGEARSRMYPDRKSQLEVLLDQYFMNERLVVGTRKIREVMPNVTEMRAPVDGVDTDLTVPGGVPMLDSWSDQKLAAWRSTHDERLHSVRTDRRIELHLDPPDSPNPALEVVAQISRSLAQEPALREQLVTWAFSADQASVSSLQRAVDRLWDGLRTLPFDDSDIATAIGNCVALQSAYTAVDSSSDRAWQHAATVVFGESIEIEFGGDDGSYSRAYAGIIDLERCARDDLAEHLAPAYRDALAGNIHGVLQAIQAPARLFEFERLNHLFAIQLAPIQVLMRTGLAVYFSAARVSSLGLP
jgi:hypothetical protein